MVAGVSGLLLAVPRAPDIAAWLLRGRLRRAGVTVTWDRARLSYLGNVSARDVAVSFSAPSGGRELRVRVPELEAVVGLPVGGPWLRSLHVRHPEVRLDFTPRDEAERPTTSRRSVEILRVGRLTVEGGRLALTHGTVAPITVAGGAVTVSGRAAPRGLALDVEAGGLELDVRGRAVVLRDIAASGTLEPEGVRVTRGTARGPSSALVIHGFAGPALSAWRVRGELDLADLPVAPPPGASRDAWMRTELRGDVEALVVVGGSATALQGVLWAPGGRAAGMALGPTRADVVLTKLGIVLPRVETETAPGHRVLGSVAAVWAGTSRYAGALRGDVPLAAIGAILERELPAEAVVVVDGTFSGEGTTVAASAAVETDALTVNDVDVGSAGGRLTVAAGELSVDVRLEGAASGPVRLGVAPGSIAIDLAGVSMDLARASRLATLPQLPWSATVTARGRLAWRDGVPAPEPLSLQLSPGRGPRTVTGALSLAGREVRQVDVELPGGVVLRGAGTGGALDAAVHAPSMEALASVVREATGAFGEPAALPPFLTSGAIDAEGRVELPPSRPLSVDATIRTAVLAAGPVVCEAASARLVVRGSLRLEQIDAACGGGTVRGHLDPSGDAELTAEGVRFGDAPDALLSGTARRDAGGVVAEGSAYGGRVQARASGAPDLATGRGEVVVSELDPPVLAAGLVTVSARVPFSWRDGELSADGPVALQPSPELGVPGIVGRIRAGGGKLTLRARDQTERIRIEGEMAIGSGVPFELQAEVDALHASPRFLDWVLEAAGAPAWTLGGPEAPWSGTVTGRVALAGSSAGLSRVEASVSELALSRGGAPVITSGGLRLRRDDAGLRIEEARADGPWVHLEGGWRSGEDPVVSGHVDLGGLTALRPGLRGSGTLRAATSGTGGLGLAVEEGALFHPDLPLAVTAVSGSASVEGGRLRVRELGGEVADGAFQITGAVGKPEDELVIRLSPVTLPPHAALRGLRGAMGGDLVVRRPGGGPHRIAGTLALTRGVYRRDVDLVALARTRGDVVPIVGEPPVLLDLKVVTADAIAVQNNLVTGSLEGELRLSGDARQPRVNAAVALLPGARATLAGQRYDVEDASLSGRDLLRGDWRAEASATTRVADYDVHVALQATGQERGGAIDVELSSSPPLPEEDLQALVLLGARAADLPPGALPALSASLLLSPVVQGIEGGFRSILHVDRVRIEPHLSTTEHAATARVTLEKSVTPDLTLVVSATAGDRREDLVGLEYSGLPDDRRVVLTREGDGSVSLELTREVAFGTP